jgi:hypothetical protein
LELLGRSARCQRHVTLVKETRTMRGVLLWLIGIPIPIIILRYLFHVI